MGLTRPTEFRAAIVPNLPEQRRMSVEVVKSATSTTLRRTTSMRRARPCRDPCARGGARAPIAVRKSPSRSSLTATTGHPEESRTPFAVDEESVAPREACEGLPRQRPCPSSRPGGGHTCTAGPILDVAGRFLHTGEDRPQPSRRRETAVVGNGRGVPLHHPGASGFTQTNHRDGRICQTPDPGAE